MAQWRFCPPLLGALILGACAVAAPTGPTVLVVPPEGKGLGQFQQEDAACQAYALQPIGYGPQLQKANEVAATGAPIGTAAGTAADLAGVGTGPATATNDTSTSATGLQQRYDIAYVQCMAAHGNQLQPFPIAWSNWYGSLGDATYDGPWVGPTVAFGFLRSSPRFHRSFVHPGYHHG
jgi:hypothetical protein